MSNEISITITIRLPEGASATIGTDDLLADLPTVAQTSTAAAPAFVPAAAEILCAIHHTPMRHGNYGPFCSKKAEAGLPADKKGYCAWRPA